MTDMRTIEKVRVYSVVSIMAVFALLGMAIISSFLPVSEFPPLYVMGVVINLTIIQIIIAVSAFCLALILTSYVLNESSGRPVSEQAVRILGVLAYLLLTFLLLVRALFTYTPYGEIPSVNDSSCVVIYSESVSFKDHHSGVLYVVGKRGGIASDTGYRWFGGHDSLPDIATLTWEKGFGVIEPWDALEPTPDRPAQIMCP